MGIQSVSATAGSGKIKKRIRDVTRLLNKPGLAATKKTEAERALAALQKDLEGAQRRNIEKKLAQKYHMVRFFERKKASRALKSSDAGDDELASWYYTTRYPKDRKYQALFVEDAKPGAFLDEVKEQMKAGKLLSGSEGRALALQESSKHSKGDTKT